MYSKFYWQTSILLNKKTMQWLSKGKRVRNRLWHTTSWGTKPIWCHLIQAFWFFSQFFPFRKWMLGSYNQSNYWNLACNSCGHWVCPLLNCSWPQLFTRTPPSLTPPNYSFCSFSPHFLPSVQHLNHLLSIIPPEFLMPGTWTVFSKLELESNCEKLQLRCILESSFPRRNCFNPDNRYSNISYKYCTFCTSPLFLHVFLSCKKNQANHFKGSKLNIRWFSGQYQSMQNIQQLYTQLLQ